MQYKTSLGDTVDIERGDTVYVDEGDSAGQTEYSGTVTALSPVSFALELRSGRTVKVLPASVADIIVMATS